MSQLSLSDPVFATYAIAASIMILKGVSMSWLTVVRMMQENGGFRAPEDIERLSRLSDAGLRRRGLSRATLARDVSQACDRG